MSVNKSKIGRVREEQVGTERNWERERGIGRDRTELGEREGANAEKARQKKEKKGKKKEGKRKINERDAGPGHRKKVHERTSPNEKPKAYTKTNRTTERKLEKSKRVKIKNRNQNQNKTKTNKHNKCL